jgi:disulfide bond formation protein DsbB
VRKDAVKKTLDLIRFAPGPWPDNGRRAFVPRFLGLHVNIVFFWLGQYLRRVFAVISLVCLGLLVFGLYLQHVVGLEPCPMCIVQRYAMVLVAVVAGFAATRSGRAALMTSSVLLVLIAGFGAFVAARQSWLQWYPPEVLSCGRDLYGMIENFPLQRVIPMVFKGSGDCAVVDWTFLGGSIANWSFLSFIAIALTSVLLALATLRRQAASA